VSRKKKRKKAKQVLLCFSYEDEKGQSTVRVVEVSGFKETDGGDWIIVGFCRVRKAIRSFRLERITDCVNANTGEEVPDVNGFLGSIPRLLRD
jgi:predicted DNA-binding transcriptional regulator YafY